MPSSFAVELTREQVAATVRAMRPITCDANANYRPATLSITSGWVDFHPLVAVDTVRLLSDSLAAAPTIDPADTRPLRFEFTVQMAEAVSKCLLGSKLKKDPEWHRLSLSARKAIAAAGAPVVGETDVTTSDTSCADPGTED